MKKKLLTISFFFCAICFGYSQTRIAIQDFETSPTTPTLTFTSDGTTSDGTSSAPSDDNSHAAGGTFGHIFNNGTFTLESGIIDASAFQNISFSMNLASLSGTSGNGADGADEVIIEISVDGGMNYSQELQVGGASNARWGYVNGEGVATAAYDNDNSATVIVPEGGGTRTTDGYGTATVTGIPSSSQLRVRIVANNNSANEIWAVDNLEFTGISATSPSVGFDMASSSLNETDATFNSLIPVTLNNYGGTPVSLSVTVSGGTAEMSDFTLNTSSLSFTSSTSQNVSIDINDDADIDAETIELTLAETTATGIVLVTSVHTIEIVDDEIPNLIISEIMYNTGGTDDEWIEVYNADGGTVTLTDWTIEVGGSTEFTFPLGATINDGDYITIALGSNGDGTYNNENVFTPDFNSLGVDNVDVAITNNTNALGNSAQTISINTDGGTIVDIVDYDDGDDSRTDGTGPSYEIISLGVDNAVTSANWQASPVAGGSPGAFSDVTIWLGTTNTNWNTASNWSNGVPSSTVNAIITDVTNLPRILNNGIFSSFDLTIDENASLSIEASATLGGSLDVNGNLVNNGSVTVAYGAAMALRGNRNGSGNATVTKEFSHSGALSMFGPSVSGAMVSDLSSDFVYFYDNSDPDLFVAPTGEMFPGEGFFIGTNSTSTYSISLTGSLTSGTVTVPGLEAAFEFIIVANPYNAPISIADFIANATNSVTTTGTVYLWNDAGSNSGGSRGGDYIAVNNMGNTRVNPGNGIDGSFNPANITGNVPSNYGFFIEIAADGNVSFTDDMQDPTAFNHDIVDFSASRSTDESIADNADRKIIKLSLSNDKLYNEIIVGFDNEATVGRDYGLDATKFSGDTNISFYSLQSDEAFAIQALPQVNSEVVIIPLGFDVAQDGTYNLNVVDFDNFGNEVTVYLNDAITGDAYDLSETNNISFQTAASNQNNRFSLEIIPNRVTSIEDESLNATSLSLVSGNINELQIGFPSNSELVNIYDLSGKVIFSERISFEGNQATVKTNLNVGQIYLIKVDGQALKFTLR